MASIPSQYNPPFSNNTTPPAEQNLCFQVHSQFSYEEYKKLTRFKRIPLFIFYFIFFGVIIFLFTYFSQDLFFPIKLLLIVLILCFLIPLAFYSTASSIKKEYQKIISTLPYGTFFSFYSTNLSIHFDTPYYSEESIFNYNMVTKIRETTDFFLLYLSSSKYHIISKKGFSQGDPGLLGTFLKNIAPTAIYIKEEK